MALNQSLCSASRRCWPVSSSIRRAWMVCLSYHGNMHCQQVVSFYIASGVLYILVPESAGLGQIVVKCEWVTQWPSRCGCFTTVVVAYCKLACAVWAPKRPRKHTTCLFYITKPWCRALFAPNLTYFLNQGLVRGYKYSCWSDQPTMSKSSMVNIGGRKSSIWEHHLADGVHALAYRKFTGKWFNSENS